ncbi:adaptor-related protein complex 3, beta 2 subunit, isoform CRA_b [Mus musculus]|jgi:AP-3 complex subunit beta|nr:adaptor-related protein complex 3, beta 2 subunit, isoform CRA_b [Mus musculus]
MSAAPAYSEDKGGSAGPGEPEYGHDPASGGIFSSDYKR